MRLGVGAAIIATALVVPGVAAAASCRGYPESIRSLIRTQVESVRLLEREGADRLVGLDTRPYPYLAGEARKAADVIAGPAELADEEQLQRCRNLVQPVRSICRGAALALATVFEAQEIGAAGTDARRTYTQIMPHCEQLMRIQPLSTSIRITN